MIHERIDSGKWIRSKNGMLWRLLIRLPERYLRCPCRQIGCGRCHKCGGFCFSSWNQMTPLKGKISRKASELVLKRSEDMPGFSPWSRANLLLKPKER